MKVGDMVMTQRTLIAETGEEIPANTVGELMESGGFLKVCCKFRGEPVMISEFEYKDVSEVW